MLSYPRCRLETWLGLLAACLLLSCASLLGGSTHRIEDWESACFEHGNRIDCIDLDRKYEAAEKAESVTPTELAQLRLKRCRVVRKQCELDGTYYQCTPDLIDRCSLTQAQAAIDAEQLIFKGCQAHLSSACIGYLTEFRDQHPTQDATLLLRVNTVEELTCQTQGRWDCDIAIRRAIHAGDVIKADTLTRQLRCTAAVKICEAEVGAHLQGLLRSVVRKNQIPDGDKLVVQQLAAANLQRGCERGEAGGCVLLLRDLEDLPRPPRLAAATAGLLRLCESGDKVICLEAAYLLATEEAVRDTARAETLIRSVCPNDRCLIESALRMYGGGAQESGVRLLQPGCEAGDLRQCQFLCSTLAHLKNPQPTEALQHCHSTCDKGVGEACWELSHLYAGGQQVHKDVKRARILLQQACSKGSELACWELKPPQYERASASEGLSALGKFLGSMAKIVGGVVVSPLALPMCALGVKDNPFCPVNWIKWK